jgi:hypothetical protein
MDGLDRLVSGSFARHGVEPTFDYRRIQWSPWLHCADSFSLVLMSSKPGVFALGEEIVAPRTVPATGGKRMLALFQISEAADLGMALGRLFLPGSPERGRRAGGCCFARYAVIEDSTQRHAACLALQNWLASSSETASGISGDTSELRTEN